MSRSNLVVILGQQTEAAEIAVLLPCLELVGKEKPRVFEGIDREFEAAIGKPG